MRKNKILVSILVLSFLATPAFSASRPVAQGDRGTFVASGSALSANEMSNYELQTQEAGPDTLIQKAGEGGIRDVLVVILLTGGLVVFIVALAAAGAA